MIESDAFGNSLGIQDMIDVAFKAASKAGALRGTLGLDPNSTNVELLLAMKKHNARAELVESYFGLEGEALTDDEAFKLIEIGIHQEEMIDHNLRCAALALPLESSDAVCETAIAVLRYRYEDIVELTQGVSAFDSNTILPPSVAEQARESFRLSYSIAKERVRSAHDESL